VSALKRCARVVCRQRKRCSRGMNSYIYGGISRISSTQTFAQYRESESYNQAQRAVNKNGDLLDYETLELRVHPPNIQVQQENNTTLITLDSANKPGTLIEVRRLWHALHTRMQRHIAQLKCPPEAAHQPSYNAN
jgi:bifunctional pyridoxal-dependent enzyme with beta-cystathionase and maltose regulon repressor activities